MASSRCRREDAPLIEADGRVLAADVAALRTQPPADLSAMDGYAVRAADVANVPVTLKVAGEVAAGHPFDGEVRPGEAARIFTGGVVPPGADTIVIQENTSRDGERVVVNHARDVPGGISAAPASISRKARCCCRAASGSPTAT